MGFKGLREAEKEDEESKRGDPFEFEDRISPAFFCSSEIALIKTVNT